MEKIFEFLKERNHYLEKFLELNEKQLIRLEMGDFEDVENFYMTRDKMLELMHVFEDLIHQRQSAIESGEVILTKEDKLQGEHLLKTKDHLVKEILAQDLEILSLIDREKSKLIKELKGIQRGRKAVDAYRTAV